MSLDVHSQHRRFKRGRRPCAMVHSVSAPVFGSQQQQIAEPPLSQPNNNNNNSGNKNLRRPFLFYNVVSALLVFIISLRNQVSMAGQMRHDYDSDNHNQALRSHSSVKTALNDKHSIVHNWGMCDPRTVQSNYQPSGSVWIVSFAGWNDQRKQKLQRLERNLASRQGIQLNTLFYAESDLPRQYYDDFAWSFAKVEYRGFWTWKPWILRNLTQTGVFRPNDLVLWMDSDEQIRAFEEQSYFETALCNMEHRNDNYAGIFPFERCFNHQEQQFTKPIVFDKMGLNATLFGPGEQIYGGSLGFRVDPDTLSFLQEWEDWGRDPVLFGNDQDFPSSTTTAAKLPKGYKQHKNDQSVFSLMVRSRNMTTWPAPYFWMGDAGVQQCLPRFQHAGYCFFFDHPKIDFDKVCRPFESWLDQLPPAVSTGDAASLGR